MKILVLSDFHLEFCRMSQVYQDRRIGEGVDVAVLAGLDCISSQRGSIERNVYATVCCP